MDGLDVATEARRWVGTPWHHQGRLFGVSIDCGGLITLTGKSLGILNFDWRAYSRIPDGSILASLCKEHLDQVDHLAVGYIILMRFKGPPQHLGILGDKGTPFSLIHAYAEARKCVEHRLDEKWNNMICGIYRYRGIKWPS